MAGYLKYQVKQHDMINHLPPYLGFLFGLTTLATLILFYRTIRNLVSARQSAFIIGLLLVWLALQAVLALSQVYSAHLDAMPPKLLILGILPPILLIAGLMMTAKGRAFVDRLPLKEITYLNSVRIAVEIGLLGLYFNQAVPRLMTFEGGNLDILSGLSAPLVAWFGFVKRVLPRRIILAWNLVCLALLINIVARALLSTSLPIQHLGFDQPNIAILVFPFVWLPAFIVPMVLFGHLVSIRQMLRATPSSVL